MLKRADVLKRATVGLVALAVATGTGCRQGGSSDGGVETRQDERPMKLTLEMRGDLDVTIKERIVETKVVVVRVSDRSLDRFQVLGIEPVDPMGEAGIRVKPGFAVVPFRGDGRYTIGAGSPYDAVTGGQDAQAAEKSDQSSVRVEWWRSDQETDVYLRREEHCTVDVEDDGMKGRLRCPRITQEGSDKRFSVDFRWEKP